MDPKRLQPFDARKPGHLEWLARQTRTYISTGVLITDKKKRVFLVTESHLDHWRLPGGPLGAGRLLAEEETPERCALRYIEEAAGLKLSARLPLLAVEWQRGALGNDAMAFPGVRFIFDGGEAPGDTEIAPRDEALSDFGFFPLGEACEHVSQSSAQLLLIATTARRTGLTLFTESDMEPGVFSL